MKVVEHINWTLALTLFTQEYRGSQLTTRITSKIAGWSYEVSRLGVAFHIT